MVFHQGDIVYLDELSKYNTKAKRYTTLGGETVRDIALRFAMKPYKIARLNKIEEDAMFKPGQVIKLR